MIKDQSTVITRAQKENQEQINTFLKREKIEGQIRIKKVLPQRHKSTKMYNCRTMIGNHQTHQDALDL